MNFFRRYLHVERAQCEGPLSISHKLEEDAATGLDFMDLVFVCWVISACRVAENLPIASKWIHREGRSRFSPWRNSLLRRWTPNHWNFATNAFAPCDWAASTNLTPAALELSFTQLHLSGLLDWRKEFDLHLSYWDSCFPFCEVKHFAGGQLGRIYSNHKSCRLRDTAWYLFSGLHNHCGPVPGSTRLLGFASKDFGSHFSERLCTCSIILKHFSIMSRRIDRFSERA